MAIKKTPAGWLVDLQPGGRGGKRFRKTLDTKGEALAYEAWLREKVRAEPEWAPSVKDRRRLVELVEEWFKHHGINLEAGENAKGRLLAMCHQLGNPLVNDFDADMFTNYRARRIKEGVSANTLNHDHAYMRAVFNELERMGKWSGKNPLRKVRQVKIKERELSFLTQVQIRRLLGAMEGDDDACLVSRLCLATGARWSEAETLRPSQLRAGAVHFAGTKSGKNRSVPVSEKMAEALKAHLTRQYGKDAEQASRFFKSCMHDFRAGVALSGLVLPKGQLTHVLRHTFASHFMMNGGNILVLQKILGHSSLTMTMRYAHLAPDHLQEAVALNPMAMLSIG